MDRLELLVHQRALNEIRGPAAILKEPFPCAEHLHEMLGRRRHVDGGLHRAPRHADPVLGATEFAGRRVLTAHTSHEAFVQLPHEPQGEREASQTRNPVLQGPHVVPDLSDVVWITTGRPGGDLLQQQLPEAGGGPFDPRREHRLPPYVRRDQQVGIRQVPPQARQLAQRRVGRLLISLFLIERGRLSQPLLYLSAYFEEHRREYYDGLQRVRTDGDWTGWIRFFLAGVEQISREAVAQAGRLMDLRERWRARLADRPKTVQLVDALLVNPYMSVARAQRLLEVSNPTARQAVARLEKLGLLTEVTGRDWRRLYLAKPILRVLENARMKRDTRAKAKD